MRNEEPSKTEEGQSRLTVGLGWNDTHRRDYRRIADNFTDIVASSLHYFENAEKVDLNTCKCDEILALHNGAIARYRTDAMFNAKVKSIVARLIQSLDTPNDVIQGPRSGPAGMEG